MIKYQSMTEKSIKRFELYRSFLIALKRRGKIYIPFSQLISLFSIRKDIVLSDFESLNFSEPNIEFIQIDNLLKCIESFLGYYNSDVFIVGDYFSKEVLEERMQAYPHLKIIAMFVMENINSSNKYFFPFSKISEMGNRMHVNKILLNIQKEKEVNEVLGFLIKKGFNFYINPFNYKLHSSKDIEEVTL